MCGAESIRVELADTRDERLVQLIKSFVRIIESSLSSAPSSPVVPLGRTNHCTVPYLVPNNNN